MLTKWMEENKEEKKLKCFSLISKDKALCIPPLTFSIGWLIVGCRCFRFFTRLANLLLDQGWADVREHVHGNPVAFGNAIDGQQLIATVACVSLRVNKT